MHRVFWNRREFFDRLMAGLGLLRLPALAQDVGMGARRGGAKRLEAPYTLDIETPHVKWAKPLPGGPIRLFAVPTVTEGRTLVEVAQRLSLDLTTVTIDPEWDNNKWTMCLGKDYGARAERGDLKLVYSYLEEDLVSTKPFDAILLPLNHGWNRLTPKSREALSRRVRDGCGLVLVRPFAGELSPLAPRIEPSDSTDPEEPREPGLGERSPWRPSVSHYITRGIPVEAFPHQWLEHYPTRPQPGSSVLIQTQTGDPILAAAEFGKGRVACYACRNAGMSWRMPMDARNDFTDVYWEYFYALLCRTLIWAARREPASEPDWDGPAAEWRLRDRFNNLLSTGKGKLPSLTPAVSGRCFLERQTASDFRISVIEPPPIPPHDGIEMLKASREIIAEGDIVDVTWEPSRPARIELIDALGRVIAGEDGAGRLSLKAGRPLVHSGWVRATAGAALVQIPVKFAAASREWTDYEVLMPWHGPYTYQPWIPALDEQFRRIGITALASSERNFKLMSSSHLPGFGIYWYRREKYLARKAAYAKTGDKKYLTRDVVLQSPEFDAGVRRQLDKSVRPVAPLKPLAYYLADESSLTCYGDAFDVDWAPEALAGFREWLRREYGTLEALNRSWGTAFRDWVSVLPMTTAEARKHGNFAPWSDHRVYMEREFVQAFSKARDMLKDIDPGARASISGTQVPTAHNGCNWYEIDRRLDYLQPYSHGDQDAMHHLFHPGMLVTGFTGYGLAGDEAQREQWRRLFYGHTGASIFWHFTLMNPDLTLSEQGEALAEAFGRIQAGIGRVFMNSRVKEDGVAIHFSMASIRGAWITDGVISAEMQDDEKSSKNYAELIQRRAAWVKELERRGLQFRFLATPEIEAGSLKDHRVLILPYSIAISDREAGEIERFMDAGGTVFADEQTGRMDERCRWRKTPLWAGERKGLARRGPGDVGVGPAVDVEGEFLRTVRTFGRSRLIGLLPSRKTTVKRPALNGVVYDLLRGGIAEDMLEALPSAPVLLIERSSRIGKLEIDTALDLRLTDESGAPVDRSVVRVEVFDPAGKLARHYTSNVTIVDGRAKFEIPFALNDRGAWRVRARDAISGLTAETEVRAGH
jgi:hypothetical protein